MGQQNLLQPITGARTDLKTQVVEPADRMWKAGKGHRRAWALGRG